MVTDAPSAVGGSVTNPEVGVGEPVQLDDLQVTIENVTYLPNHPEAPPGFAFFVLDGLLQNVGGATIDSGAVRVTLIDETGNQYVLNPIASTLGEQPAPDRWIPDGRAVFALYGWLSNPDRPVEYVVDGAGGSSGQRRAGADQDPI